MSGGTCPSTLNKRRIADILDNSIGALRTMLRLFTSLECLLMSN